MEATIYKITGSCEVNNIAETPVNIIYKAADNSLVASNFVWDQTDITLNEAIVSNADGIPLDVTLP